MTALGRGTLTSLSLCALVVTLGCSSTVQERERDYFKEIAQVSELATHPFHRAWYDSNVNWESYKGIYVRPVTYASLREQTWWNHASFKQGGEEVVKEVLQYLEHAIKKAFADAPTRKLPVVDKPGPEIVVVDLALVELVPTKTWERSSSSRNGQSVIDESVAMEGTVREGETDRVIAMFADRQVGNQKLMDMTESVWSFHIYRIMDTWANQIVMLPHAMRKKERDRPFIDFQVESMGAAFADMFSKLGSVPRLGLRTP